MFFLCDNPTTIAEAVHTLSKASCIFLDCEGRDLGSQNGALSVVSLGSLHSDVVYLIDVISLAPDSLRQVFSLIEDKNLRKVVWDGRMDFSELFLGHSTSIDANVLDLQLVDIASRPARGESEHKRTQRLCSKLPWRETKKLELEGMHALCSLDRALREHALTDVAKKEANVKKAHANNSTEMWMQRPLSDELLAYAAGDIERIAALYDHFTKMGYLEDALLPDLLSQSARYVGFFRTIGRPSPENRFWRSALLPFGILHLHLEDPQICAFCKRGLSQECFPTAGRGSPNDDGTFCCRVCKLILSKDKFMSEKVATEKVNNESPN